MTISDRSQRRLAAVLVVLVAGLSTAWGLHLTWHWTTDWVFFQVGARVLVHFHNQNIYTDPRLHLYVDNPDLQMGPPPLWIVAAMEWLPVATIAWLSVAIMGALGAVAGIALLSTARSLYPSASATMRVGWLLAALVFAGVWGFNCAKWRHLDDALALSLAAVAVALIARGRESTASTRMASLWWLAAACLGTAAASKPWALILAPLLLGLPRVRRAKAIIVFLAVAGAWWAPFIIAAPDTISALGHFQILPTNGSVLWLFGIHSDVSRWLRPTQFLLGIGVGCWVALHRGWISAGLAALALRVMTDPFSFAYYGLGPLVFALAVDLLEAPFGAWPVVSAVTWAVEYGAPEAGIHGDPIAICKLIWALTILATIISRRRTRHTTPPTVSIPRQATTPNDAAEPATVA